MLKTTLPNVPGAAPWYAVKHSATRDVAAQAITQGKGNRFKRRSPRGSSQAKIYKDCLSRTEFLSVVQ